MNFIVAAIAIIVGLILFNKFINTRGVIQINAQTALELAKDPALTILDVRTPQEFSEGHIANARLLPVAELSEKINELAALKEQPLLVYCHAGNRSASASQILRKNGFTKVHNLQGGISAWISIGNAVVK
jgi:rhodanese-related sulfurtransferase